MVKPADVVNDPGITIPLEPWQELQELVACHMTEMDKLQRQLQETRRLLQQYTGQYKPSI